MARRLTPADYAQRVRDNVRQHGFHTTYVGAGQAPEFCYSTGIFETHGLPEIIVSSLPSNLSHELITQYVERFRGAPPPIGQRIKAVRERFDYYLIPVPLDRIREYVLASFQFYGEQPFEYWQLVYPDPDLLFPHEAGYDYDQELLGTFPPDS